MEENKSTKLDRIMGRGGNKVGIKKNERVELKKDSRKRVTRVDFRSRKRTNEVGPFFYAKYWFGNAFS